MFLYKHKNGFWYARDDKLIQTKSHRQSTGTKDKSKANKWMTDFKNKPKGIVYLSDFKAQAIRYAETNLSKKSQEMYHYSLNVFLKSAGDKPLSLYRPIDFENLKQLKVSHGTINLHLRTLKAIFNLAVKFEYLDKNPVTIKPLPIIERGNLAFTPEVLRVLLSNFPQSLRDVYRIYYYTGLRLRDVTNLTWKDVDFNKRKVTVLISKSKKVKQIPINDELLEVLQGFKVKNIDGKIIPFKPDYISRQFKKVLRKLGFNEKYRFHCLRHSFTSELAHNGVPLNVIQELLCHSKITTTMKYVHTLESDLHKAVGVVRL